MASADTADLEPIYVSVKKAASMLGITPWSVYEVLKEPNCPLDARYFGKRRLVSVESIRDYAAGLPVEKPEAAS